LQQIHRDFSANFPIVSHNISSPTAHDEQTRNCATKPDMYYEVSQAVQLNSVFASIAQNLANLRISK
jgi:hypothetical protein